ncbi:MAG: IPT/TIG domain-containing protein, partial [Bacteroidota bacterium]
MQTGTFFSPSNVQPGTNITVTATVKNQSNAGNTYTNVPLKAKLINPSGSVLNQSSTTIPSLVPGLSGIYYLNLTMPVNAPNGNYQILVEIVPSCDNNPINNSISLGLYMGPSLGNEQFIIPDGSTTLETNQTIIIAGNVFTFKGVNTSQLYATFRLPDGSLDKVYVDHIKYWNSFNAMIALEGIDGGSPATAFIKPGQSDNTGPTFTNNLIVCSPGQSITFEATAPSGRTFYSDEFGDYPIFVSGTIDGNPNIVKNWITMAQRTNGNTKVLLSFTIPSSATIKTYTLYIVTPYASSPPEYMSRLQIQVDPPLPHITELSTYIFSADDILTIAGTNFGTSTGNVLFSNNLNGSIISWNNTQIVCKVPNGVQSGNVLVINGAGASNGISYQVFSSTGDPIVVQPIPDQSMQQNSTLIAATLSNVFSDPNNDPLVFSANSSSTHVSTSIVNGILSITTDGEFSGQTQITVSATDLDNATAQDIFTITVLQNIPFTPSSLNATAISGSNIVLIWENVGNEDGYHIYRAPDIISPFVLLNSVGADTTTYSDIDLSINTQYCYKVVAFNTAGNSGDSPISCATTFGNQLPPVAPSFIYTTAISNNQIDSQWENVEGEDGYVLWTPQIGIIPMLWEITLGPDVTSYSHTGLPSGTEVCYYVRAFNSSGDSPDTGPSCATTLNAIPLITTSVSSLPSFGEVPVGTSSAPQSYTVSGTNLTSNISIIALPGFEISLTSNSG